MRSLFRSNRIAINFDNIYDNLVCGCGYSACTCWCIMKQSRSLFSIIFASQEDYAYLFVNLACITVCHFFFLMVSGFDCGLWLWHFLEFSIHFFNLVCLDRRGCGHTSKRHKITDHRSHALKNGQSHHREWRHVTDHRNLILPIKIHLLWKTHFSFFLVLSFGAGRRNLIESVSACHASHSPSSADSRRAVVRFWRKNVH